MSKSFLKFKRRARMQSVASAALLGVGVGVMALAIVIAVSRLCGLETSWLYYAVCLGGGAIASVPLYFAFMPSDRRLAKRLDFLYSLDERVSTMLELCGEEGGFAELQREDAESRLAQESVKDFKSRRLIAGILVFSIAVVSMVGAWIIPEKTDDGEAPIGEFDKQWLLTAVDELIATVEIAFIDEDLRTASLLELRGLRSFIESSELLSQMKAEAIRTVIGINAALGAANPAEAIGEAMSTSSNEYIAALGNELSGLSGSGSRKAMENLGKQIAKADSDEASFIADEINACLQSSCVRSDDAMYLLFKSLTASVKNSNANADDDFEDAGKTLSSSVLLQNVNRATMNVVINKLCNLFGITASDVEEVDPDTDVEINTPTHGGSTSEDTEGKEPDVDIGTGGLGTGDVIYGSDDLIFDPDTGTYRPYGEVINEYFAKINEYITDGKISEEMADALEEYFSDLFGGTDKVENDK